MEENCTCAFGPIDRVASDEQGYCVSFAPDQLAEIEAFFLENGFVVVRDAVPDELRAQVVADLWKAAGFEDGQPPSDLDAVDWTNDVYRSLYNTGKGFVGSRPCVGQAPTAVRERPELVRVFQRLLHQDALYAKFDRYGLMRPTDRHPEWKTDRGFVHWDQNPTLEPRFARVQGVVALTEHTSTSGGFWAIPKFCGERYTRWAATFPRTTDDGMLIDVTDNCLRHRHAQKITMRAGSICIWDSRTPHGNWPNEGTAEWRCCFYLTYFCQPESELVRKMWGEMCARMAFAGGLTPLGRKVFGLDAWPADGALSDNVDKESYYTAAQCGYMMQ